MNKRHIAGLFLLGLVTVNSSLAQKSIIQIQLPDPNGRLKAASTGVMLGSQGTLAFGPSVKNSSPIKALGQDSAVFQVTRLAGQDALTGLVLLLWDRAPGESAQVAPGVSLGQGVKVVEAREPQQLHSEQASVSSVEEVPGYGPVFYVKTTSPAGSLVMEGSALIGVLSPVSGKEGIMVISAARVAQIQSTKEEYATWASTYRLMIRF
ncbi:MAG: hypothetical protein HC842_01070 [Cytophagales bacterium]|nr:hypothetical protein [Cytophagales bacterium]